MKAVATAAAPADLHAASTEADTVREFLHQAELELRKPLSLIQGYIETLKSGVVKGGEQLARCLEVMDKHSRRLMHVLEDMNAVANLEPADKVWNCDAPLMLRNIEVAVEQLAPDLVAREVAVTHHVPAGSCCLRLDRRLWQIVLIKLLEALLKMPGRGFRIHLEVVWKKSGVTLIASTECDEAGGAACCVPQTTDGYGELELLVARRVVELAQGCIQSFWQEDGSARITLTIPGSTKAC
jgi:signal transduction histidine kinase